MKNILIASTAIALLLFEGAAPAFAAPAQRTTTVETSATSRIKKKDGTQIEGTGRVRRTTIEPVSPKPAARTPQSLKKTHPAETSNSFRDGAQPFLTGAGGDMKAVADMADVSLAKNPAGTSPVSDKLCKEQRACITPLELFTQIKEKHPDVGIGNDVHDLPSYLRTLVKNEHPGEGKRTVGRVIVKNGVRKMDYGYSRAPAPGEAIWTDVNTGEEVFMGRCLNTIDLATVSELIVEAPCAYHLVRVHKGGALNFALMGRYQNDACFKYVYLGASPEVPEGTELDWLPLPTRCPEGPCNFAGFEQFYPQPIMQSGGLKTNEGYYLMAVSIEFAKNKNNIAAYCHDHSCSIDIHDTDYHRGVIGGMQATIYLTRDEAAAKDTGRLLYWAMPDKNNKCPPD